LHASPPAGAPHTFPTRRSSDLDAAYASSSSRTVLCSRPDWWPTSTSSRRVLTQMHWSTPTGRRSSLPPIRCTAPSCGEATAPPRSEEHTSELQSRSDLVCRLLL